MINSVIYNIPDDLVSAYQGRQVIVRSNDAVSIVEKLSGEKLENVEYVQLLSADAEPDSLEPLANWGRDVPLDIVIRNPASEFPLLYNFSKLLDKHPIRASIAVKPGFVKAVKLALALNFAVKLEVGQPGPELIEEMREMLDVYLHRPNVSRPVDYFHGIFLSYYKEEPVSLWCVQEEDPDYYRFITDDGVETVSPRFEGADLYTLSSAPTEDSIRARAHGEVECDKCEFMDRCGGYFKWPDKNFSCEGVKSIFGAIRGAASELRQDVATFAATQGGAQP